MAIHNVAAVILPTTHYLLKLIDPPVRKLIDGGVIFALGSNFNPNCYCMSMPLVMNMACVNLKAKLSETLVGATLNAAFSLCLSETHGSLENGKFGDMVVIN